MRQQILFHLLWITALVGAGLHREPAASPAKPTSNVTIFAAASTKDVIEQLAKNFERSHGATVTVVPGPSSGLAKQIDQGARADLFLSADEASADFLAKKGMVAERHDLLTNRLVVIVPADSDLKIKELADLDSPAIKHLAVAEAKVPAGEYARQTLKKSGVLERVSRRFVGGVDVRQTLTFVARGEAEAGFVYLTDTIGNSRVRRGL